MHCNVYIVQHKVQLAVPHAAQITRKLTLLQHAARRKMLHLSLMPPPVGHGLALNSGNSLQKVDENEFVDQNY